MVDLLSNVPVVVSVLDKGYVRLVDCMPRLVEAGETCDHAVVDAARVSYQKGTQRKRSDQGLINFLLSHKHTSPFEQVIFKFEMKMPMFVARELVRHRTASLNEESARYSVLSPDFYFPSEWRQQGDQANKQMSGEAFGEEQNRDLHETLCNFCEDAYQLYKQLLATGVAREMARMVLPVNIYTSMVWSMDLHNLLHFITLRSAPNAQLEIQEYANAIVSLIAPLIPYTYLAYQAQQSKRSFSAQEMNTLLSLDFSHLEDFDSNIDALWASLPSVYDPENPLCTDYTARTWQELTEKVFALSQVD